MGHDFLIAVASEFDNALFGRKGQFAVHNVHSASLGANFGLYTFRQVSSMGQPRTRLNIRRFQPP